MKQLLFFTIFCPLVTWAQYDLGSSPQSSFGGGSAHEGFYGSAGFFYGFDDRDRSSSSSTSATLYNVRLGYSFSNGIRIGLKYAAENSSTTDSSNSRNDKESVTDQGVLVGYQYEQFFATLGYLFDSEWKYNNGNGDSVFKNASGIQLDIGMEFSVGNNIYIGPRLTYKNITYKTQVTSGSSTDLDPTLNRAYLDPFFFVTYRM